MAVWVSYINTLGPLFFLVAVGFFGFTGLRTYSDFHLSAWVQPNHNGWSMTAWMAVYVSTVLASLVVMLATLAGLVVCTLRAARLLHDTALRAVMRGTMAYFNSTPVGRILNRFSS